MSLFFHIEFQKAVGDNLELNTQYCNPSFRDSQYLQKQRPLFM